MRKWDAADAAVHDSKELDDLLHLSNPGKEVWADSAYRSVQIEAGLKEKGLQSRIHRRAARNRPLSERQRSANTTRSKVRARVEHVFGHQQTSMGGKIVRTAPPRKLGKHGRQLWDRVQAEFGITDIGGIELLTLCCQSLDRAESLERFPFRLTVS